MFNRFLRENYSHFQFELSSYIGGKSRIAPKLIIPEIPRDITIYCELFGGMMWTFFKMDLSVFPNLEMVIYNDINIQNVNLFKCVKYYEEFYQYLDRKVTYSELRFKRYQRELFNEGVSVEINDCPDFEMAFKYLYVLNCCYNGMNPERANYCLDIKRDKIRALMNKLANPGWQSHFDKLSVIYRNDYSDIISDFDSPTTFFYTDPPYYGCEKYYANHSFNLDSHKSLSDSIKAIEGRFSLSYYDFDVLQEMYPKDEFRWLYKDFTRNSSSDRSKKGRELLIMNY